MNTYWVYQWIDEHGIKDATDAARVLSSKKGLAGLADSAPSPDVPGGLPATDRGTSIVAGRGLDLSGELDCDAAECRLRQAHDLFRHVWHYFDEIVVPDAVAQELRMHKECGRQCLEKSLPSHIDVLLYLREMGAENLVNFRARRPPCLLHLTEHVEETGMSAVLDPGAGIAARLAAEGEVSLVDEREGINEYVFVHPEFEHSVWVSLQHDDAAKMADDELQIAVASSVLERYTAHPCSDLWASKQAGAPLGSILALHRALLLERPPTVQATAFEIDLPILQNVRIPDVIRLRNEERDLFERLQTNLRQAIAERIRQQGTTQAVDIAADVRRDLIEPDLRKIRERLSAAEQLFNRKAAVTIGVGVLATVCGVLSGVAPLITGAASGMLTAGGTHLNKYLEERRNIAESDYYFLWRASKH